MPITAVEAKMSEGMTITQPRKAIVLLSGGMDSTVTAYIAKRNVGRNGELYAMTFDYGQTHVKEVQYAEEIGRLLEVESHHVIKAPLGNFVNSTLLSGEETTFRRSQAMKLAFGLVYGSSWDPPEGIPNTWVPQRNSIFLALAFAYAETIGAGEIYIGVNSRDYSGYPDCRPEFIEAMSRSLNLASKQFVETGKGVNIIAPLQYLSKTDIIRRGMELGVDFSKTWSCYRGGKLACGRCPSCIIRLEAFRKLGMEDPIKYE